MSITPANEYPALLPLGFHELTMDQLRKLCVDTFPGSTTRPKIISGLETVISRIRSVNLTVEIWINGSFLTQKTNPTDSDILVTIEEDLYYNITQEQKEVIDWIKSDLKNDCLCDSYLLIKYPESSDKAVYGDFMKAYWMRQFGFGRDNGLKGIVVLSSGRN